MARDIRVLVVDNRNEAPILLCCLRQFLGQQSDGFDVFNGDIAEAEAADVVIVIGSDSVSGRHKDGESQTWELPCDLAHVAQFVRNRYVSTQRRRRA